ncbi:hypothetical protein ACBY01_15680 [Sphingomonas sp. ac-8]|uniref:hypothetical protein n=1 Tax=Sphingomonas sp. ac-8 TaxID=3242977 RepID=UPI003A7FBC39
MASQIDSVEQGSPALRAREIAFHGAIPRSGRWTIGLLFAASVCSGIPAFAGQTASRCVVASHPETLVTIAGKLTLQSFAGPPNYESVVQGDAEEQALILELPRQICLEDGEFADGSERFDRVHVIAIEPQLIRTLRQSVGREITVAGRAVGAHTGHHHAPMVLFAGAIAVRESGKDTAEGTQGEKPE